MPEWDDQRPADVVLQRVPDLARGPNATTGSAVQDVRFVGEYGEWPGFEADVRTAFSRHHWRRHDDVLGQQASDPDVLSLNQERVRVGDETGIQGRFQQHVGNTMSVVFASQRMDLVLGDFRSTDSTYRRVPDVAGSDAAGVPKLVGELKTPWVDAHRPSRALVAEDRLRKMLGQLARYLKQNCLRYGFLSTYEETVFVRQHRRGRIWELQLSPVIRHTSSPASDGRVSLRQCFFFIGREALANPTVMMRGLADDAWFRVGI